MQEDFAELKRHLNSHGDKHAQTEAAIRRLQDAAVSETRRGPVMAHLEAHADKHAATEADLQRSREELQEIKRHLANHADKHAATEVTHQGIRDDHQRLKDENQDMKRKVDQAHDKAHESHAKSQRVAQASHALVVDVVLSEIYSHVPVSVQPLFDLKKPR